MHLLFVTAADSAIGFGHLNRCLSIASAVAFDQITTNFFILGDDNAAEIMEKTGYRYNLYSSKDFAQGSINTSELINDHFDVALVDLIHSSFFDQGNNANDFFKRITKFAHIVAVIDSLGEQSLAAQLPNAPIDFLVAPYALDEPSLSRIHGVGRHQIHGVEYALLSPAYLGAPLRVARANANRILVTCGGSDPTEMSLVVLEGLEQLESQYELRVIIGPLFEKGLKTKIEDFCNSSMHNISLIINPDNLADHMLWCDIAISASGLTKYELAATGTPAILFSIDTKHDFDNRPFAELRTAIDMGLSTQSTEFAEKTFNLLNNLIEREEMMQTGLELIDGKGAHRLMTEFTKELSC